MTLDIQHLEGMNTKAELRGEDALLDHFAGIALPLVWRSDIRVDDHESYRRGGAPTRAASPHEVAAANAQAAYDVARAMLAVRHRLSQGA